MGATTGSGGSGGFVAEINVTPFVDVMLVLLIIFMVTAPMMTEGVDVELPRTKMVETLPDDDAGVLLTVRADGSLYLDERRTDMAGLERWLAGLAASEGAGGTGGSAEMGGPRVFLRADRDVPYGTVVEVIGLVRAAGVEKLGMVSEREGSGDDAPR
ncbi:ExbD/TolR family protein [Nitratidesulfovibrio sp. 1201_IL3209]|uniref:ExbD/TolR family protein n=1 Tax=Nitratidesulfovibrio sp. 1201_IL3209 TaxID=3084053 RepID=UPI002FDB186F